MISNHISAYEKNEQKTDAHKKQTHKQTDMHTRLSRTPVIMSACLPQEKLVERKLMPVYVI